MAISLNNFGKQYPVFSSYVSMFCGVQLQYDKDFVPSPKFTSCYPDVYSLGWRTAYLDCSVHRFSCLVVAGTVP
jgi:hypothetical protein